MSKEDKLKWLIQEGFIEKASDGQFRLTEEVEYLTEQFDQEKDKTDGH